MNKYCSQRTFTLRGSITVQLTSSLTGLDLTKEVKQFFIQHQIGQPCSENLGFVLCCSHLVTLAARFRRMTKIEPKMMVVVVVAASVTKH